MIFREGIEVLGRYIDTSARHNTLEYLIGDVVTNLNVGNLPISRILNLTLTEQVVPT